LHVRNTGCSGRVLEVGFKYSAIQPII